MNMLKKTHTAVHCHVLSATLITPHMRRLVLGGPEINAWLATPEVHTPAAWVKVFPEGIKGRAYTIREIDLDRSTITLDFVMHGHDQSEDTHSVSAWAKYCQAGDAVQIAGPRNGGFQLAEDTDWLWIGADLTALPAAIRIIESLPAHIQVAGLFIVDSLEDQQEIHNQCKLRTRWRTLAVRPDLLADRNVLIKDIDTLKGNGQVWIAGEARWTQSWKQYWLTQKQLAANKVSSKGYWKLGEIDYRD